MHFLQHLPLKYKFWAVNSVAFIATLLLVLVAVWVEQHSIQNQRIELGEAVLAEAQPDSRPSLPGMRWLNAGTPGLNSGNATPTWRPAAQLMAPLSSELQGVWIKQNQALGVEHQSYFSLLLDRAPLYALVVCCLMLLVLTVSQLLITFITRNILKLRDTMTLVQQTGDLTLRAQSSSRDEVGSMAAAFNAMQQAQQQVVAAVRQAALELDQGAGNLAGLMGQVRDGMVQQQAETDQVAAAVNEMSATVQDIAGNSSTTRDQSSQADALASDGRDQVEQVRKTITGLATSIERCTHHMQTLAANSEDISGVVQVIRSIAEQTNLLALNAAIEAARAGESGRGFAVVADEVRALAQRVQSSTDDIQRMIETLQNGTQAAVQDMQASAALTHDSVEQVAQAGDSLHEIASAVSQISRGNSEIASAVDQQSQVAEAITQSIVEIRDVTERTVDQTMQSAATSDQLAKLAHQLKLSVSKLKA
ncbi:methyl-accepting chemotaxis protein [Halopseudomonas sp.]|uniref:methyl-accepting chemotaxis protein n=1 Tax=Halopseudomonas sp. TaxID=2901191 RepID=UPI003FA5ECD9